MVSEALQHRCYCSSMGGVEEDRTGTGRQRGTVSEAAEILGVSVEAVRGRIKRGTLEAERTEEGVLVYLAAGQSPTGRDQSTDQARPAPNSELVEELRDRISYLERMLEEEREARTEERLRHDTLMAELMRHIPQIEAPQEPPGAPETATEQPGRVEPQPSVESAQEPPQPRSWLRRMFGS